MNIDDQLYIILEKVKRETPLVHHITNYVTVNDCANVVLAIGGSPVMADDKNEVEEMVSIASALVLNIGTLNERTVESFILAGKKANQLNIPVILDPVGIGATNLRNKTVHRILKEVRLTVLRGNMSEIKNIYGIETETKGVDSIDNSLDGGYDIAKNLAKKLRCIVAISGATDIISDGNKTYFINNGHQMLSGVTGTGCMSSSLIGVCCGVAENSLYGAITGVLVMGIAGEIAQNCLKDYEGLGSFRTYLIDTISNFSIENIKERGKINEIK